MPEYRFFSLKDDKIAGPGATAVCDSDKDAIKEGEARLNGLDIEIWDGARKVARLQSKDRS
jgi:hypothetical protein